MGTELLSLVDTDKDAVTGFRTIPIGYEATGCLHRRAQLSEGMLKQCYVLIMGDFPGRLDPRHTRLLLDNAVRATAVKVHEPIMCAVVRYVETCNVWFVGSVAAPAAADVALPRERLAFVRTHLSLNISQLAAVFDVGRKTVYQWVAGETVPRAGHQRRIKTLFDIAVRWSELCSKPVGDLLQTPFSANTSLLDLLRLPQPDEAILDRILTDLRQARDRADLESVPWGKTADEIALERGIPLPDEESRRRNVDDAVLHSRILGVRR
jgi:transcriptional regulator with XRE-family HTH domain